MIKFRFLKSIYLFVFIFIASIKLFGGPVGVNPRWLYGARERHRRTPEEIEAREKMWNKLPRLKKEAKDLEFQLAENSNDENIKFKLDIKRRQIKSMEIMLGGSWGDIILRGIAGTKGWEMAEDLEVGDNKLEGLYKGIALRGFLSFGDALGKSADGYVGRGLDVFLGKLENFISFIYRFMFRSSCKPFEIEEVISWKKLVVSDLKEIEAMIKNAEKYDSRGRVEILREYELQDEDNSKTVNLWQDFVEDVARTYEDLALEIDLRQGYYEKKEYGFGIVQCSQRLRNKLLKAQNWLLRVKSLKEFVNTPEVKSIIPSMKRSFENYFNNLAEQIHVLNGKRSELKISGSKHSSRDMWHTRMDDDDDEYPSAFMR